jgi:hypothetical protein
MMETIVSAAMEELREEISEPIDADKEPSRLIRLMHLKYKCCVIFFLAVIAALLIVYITIKEILDDDQAGTILNKVFDRVSAVYFPNATVSPIQEMQNK